MPKLCELALQGEGEHKFPSGHYDIAGWDLGLRHGPATYFNTKGENADFKDTLI